MARITETDYETREVEQTRHICDRCGAEGADNHLFGEIQNRARHSRLHDLRANRVADYCDGCYDDLTHQERVRINNREAVDTGGTLAKYSVSVDVKRLVGVLAVVVWTVGCGYWGATGGITTESGEAVHPIIGAVLGPILGWCLGAIALMMLVFLARAAQSAVKVDR